MNNINSWNTMISRRDGVLIMYQQGVFFSYESMRMMVMMTMVMMILLVIRFSDLTIGSRFRWSGDRRSGFDFLGTGGRFHGFQFTHFNLMMRCFMEFFLQTKIN